MTLVRDLFDLPEHIGKGDFVLQLSRGVEHPEETVNSYVVTEPLVDAFDRALGLVGSSLKSGRSQAAYLHGSFGSGKSHFMAVLSLLLRGHEVAWRVPELHALRDKYGFVGKKKLLELHFHMVGKDNIESAILGGYVDHVAEHYPEATIPGVFADDQLFEDARRMLDELGDAAFFAPMNAGVQATAQEGWGEFAGEALWDRERFDRAASSPDVREREKLFSALVKTRFTAYAQERRNFIGLDEGLAVIARHARELGHDAIVLFLDELILWLSHRASESGWLHNEVQKMVKLVEAQEATRDIPIVSFIARQRNLAEMVGEQYAGADAARLQDSLKHWEGRYDTITLEDRNLPAIIEKRVLKPKNEEASRELDRAFETLRKNAGSSWDALLGREDAASFRRTYPFSPALVESLVALSSFLQRERTAIRVLMEMLVEHMDDLGPGEVVRVGDLFDLLAGGEEAVDGTMRARFETAKQLYNYQLRPIIQEQQGTATAERCQRLRDDHPTRIGCSNCAELACRADNRLAKTLLTAALVPQVPALKDLTAGRLHALNYGSVRSRIAGTEAGQVAQRLRKWASEISQLRVGDQLDPSVSVQLEGVDVGPILEAARDHDTLGARQRVLRDLLFDSMGQDKINDWGKDIKLKWRGTDRVGHLRFGNVRRMTAEQLTCPENHDWRLIVDYPFDEPGFGPNDDRQVIDAFMDEGDGSWTLVWLPHFLSASANKLLGELVILEHILESKDTERKYIADLSIENQARASLDLSNLRNQKRARLRLILEQAYGLAKAEPDVLDSGAMVDQQLVVLKPGAVVQQTLAANLADALDNYVPALLEARYPRHPRFTKALTPKRVEDVVERFGELVDSDDKRIAADRGLVEEINGTLGVLGLARTTENAVHLVEDRTLAEIERRRAQSAIDEPTAAQVRAWVDEGGRMGLQPPALDLVLRCYARWAKRTFMSLDKPYAASAKQVVPGDVILEKPELPSQVAWAKAYDLAGAMLGVSLAGRALHADNLKRFEAVLGARLKERAKAAAALPGALRGRLDELGLDVGVDRMRTARSGDALVTALQGKGAVLQVNALAEFNAETSARAVGQSLADAEQAVAVLENKLVFGVFHQLATQRATLPGAEEVLENVVAALRQDEINVSLAPRLEQLAEEGQRLLSPPVVEAAPKKGRRVLHRVTLAGDGARAREALEEALAQVDDAAKEHGQDVAVTGSLEISVPEKP
jgi:hypothetical protein